MTDYVSTEEYQKFRTAVIKKLKKLDGLISDLFQSISDLDNNESQLIDEALERAQRAERAVRRLKRDFDDHEHEDE
jgi:prefoldin subunit 5